MPGNWNSQEEENATLNKVLRLTPFRGAAQLSSSCRYLTGEESLMEQEEHRSGKDRRSGVDRRKANDPNYKGPERRSGLDRRSGIDRRKPA